MQGSDYSINSIFIAAKYPWLNPTIWQCVYSNSNRSVVTVACAGAE